MVGMAILAVWFLLVATMLLRQWWVSELAQAHDGVDASAPAPLPALAGSRQQAMGDSRRPQSRGNQPRARPIDAARACCLLPGARCLHAARTATR